MVDGTIDGSVDIGCTRVRPSQRIVFHERFSSLRATSWHGHTSQTWAKHRILWRES